jgi:hypothetical protein
MKHMIALAVAGMLVFAAGTQQSHAGPATEAALLLALVAAGPAPDNLTSKPEQNQSIKLKRNTVQKTKK